LEGGILLDARYLHKDRGFTLSKVLSKANEEGLARHSQGTLAISTEEKEDFA
jgi:hypothetical protein